MPTMEEATKVMEISAKAKPWRMKSEQNSLAEELDIERRKVMLSAIIAGILLLLLWLILGFENYFELNLNYFGVIPRKLVGLRGILFAPLLHGDYKHLISNSIPLFFLLTGTLYFYRGLGYKVFLLIWIFSGVGVWCIGRDSIHIGASGVVYGLATFLAISGILRNDIRLMAISLLTIFLYGGMIWGVLPLFQHVSWESHLMGSLVGLFCAVYYRKQGPPQRQYDLEPEEDDEESVEVLPAEPLNETIQHHTAHPNYIIIYRYKNKEDENTETKA